MRLEMAVMAGPESKQFLVDFTKQLDRMESLIKKSDQTFATSKTASTDSDDTVTDEEDDFAAPKATKTAAKTATKKAAASFDDEDETDEVEEDTDETDSESFDDDAKAVMSAKNTKASAKKAAASFDDEDETDEEETKPATKTAAKTKPKKVTLDDVNDACKARVASEISTRGCTGKDARAAVLKLLTKKFKVSSVSELKPDQYEAVVTTMKG